MVFRIFKLSAIIFIAADLKVMSQNNSEIQEIPISVDILTACTSTEYDHATLPPIEEGDLQPIKEEDLHPMNDGCFQPTREDFQPVEEGDLQPVDDDHRDDLTLPAEDCAPVKEKDKIDQLSEDHAGMESRGTTIETKDSSRKNPESPADTDMVVLEIGDAGFDPTMIIEIVRGFKEKRHSLQKKSKIAKKLVSVLGVAGGVIGGAIGEVYKYAVTSKGEYLAVWLTSY